MISLDAIYTQATPRSLLNVHNTYREYVYPSMTESTWPSIISVHIKKSLKSNQSIIQRRYVYRQSYVQDSLRLMIIYRDLFLTPSTSPG